MLTPESFIPGGIFFIVGFVVAELRNLRAKRDSKNQNVQMLTELKRVGNLLADQREKDANPKTAEEANEIRRSAAEEITSHLTSLPRSSQLNIVGSTMAVPLFGTVRPTGELRIRRNELMNYDKKLSKVKRSEAGTYQLECTWNGSITLPEQYAEARQHCDAWDVILDYDGGLRLDAKSQKSIAYLVGGSDSKDRNLEQLNCIRRYFLERLDWEQGETPEY
jgi:hypothetical protein